MKNIKTIYLVDDDEDDRMLIREALESANEHVKIIEINDGKDLLEMIGSKDADQYPSLIMLDMNMPRMTGMESLYFLKLNPAYQHIPIVMISTSSNQKLIQQAYDLGINAYIAKPVSFKEYSKMAEAVNVCFLNNIPVPIKETISNKSCFQKILVVEDNDDHWNLMNESFNRSMPDLQLNRTKNGKETLNFLINRQLTLQSLPEIILLDLYMPTLEKGLNILEEIRYFFSTQNLAPVPIIILSSSDHEEDINASYRHQASAYMIKSPDLLRSFAYIKDLCHFWLSIISPPSVN